MTLLLLLAVIGLVGLNAFFVSAEYALVRSRADRVEAAVERGDRGAVLFMRQIESIDEYIAACQVGITMASIALGAVGEPTIQRPRAKRRRPPRTSSSSSRARSTAASSIPARRTCSRASSTSTSRRRAT